MLFLQKGPKQKHLFWTTQEEAINFPHQSKQDCSLALHIAVT